MVLKVAVITGGSKGIGYAVANRFSENRYRVLSLSRKPTTLDNAESGIEHLQCDVTDERQIQDTISKIVATYGRLDVLVNSAGINKDSLLLKTKYDDIHSLLETNLVGTILMCKWTVKAMLQQKSGTIVNIGSLIGQKGNMGQSVYSATKSGLVGFTKSLAKEVGSRGITANVIAPGFVVTDMTQNIGNQEREQLCKNIPLQRLGTTSEVAETVYFIAHSPYITGQVLYCDGGHHTAI